MDGEAQQILKDRSALGSNDHRIKTYNSQDLLDSTNSDPDFMNTIITADESWVHGYDRKLIRSVIFLTMKFRREH